MGALSNIDIENVMKDEKNFRGVFPRDALPKQIRKLENGVINLDKVTGNGTHWVCYFNNPKYKYVEYFDSFGLPPPEEVKRYLKTSNKMISYNSSQLQQELSNRCGWYCIKYIKERNKNRSPYEVLYSFTQEPSDHNEYSLLSNK